MIKKIVLVVVCSVGLLLMTFPNITSASSETTLYIEPSEIKANVNDVFIIDVNIANVELLYGFEYKLGWNSTILDIVKFEPFPPWVTYIIIKNEIGVDPETGLNYYWSSSQALSLPHPFTGNTTLARLTFKAVKAGSSILNLYDAYLVDIWANPIPHDVYDGYVEVELRGDVNYDGIVDISDVVLAAVAFGSTHGDPKWDPDADLNNDDLIDIVDLVIIGVNFGKKG